MYSISSLSSISFRPECHFLLAGGVGGVGWGGSVGVGLHEVMVRSDRTFFKRNGILYIEYWNSKRFLCYGCCWKNGSTMSSFGCLLIHIFEKCNMLRLSSLLSYTEYSRLKSHISSPFFYVHTLSHKCLHLILIWIDILFPEVGPHHLLIFCFAPLIVICGKNGSRGKRGHQKICLQNFWIFGFYRLRYCLLLGQYLAT